MSAAILCDNLTKTYGKARGITELSFSVEDGAFYGFIGPNGAGKSTTIRTLLGLISPSGGAARVLGLNPQNAADRQKILAQVGYLPGETQFYPDMKVGEVIRFSSKLHKKDCTAEAKRLCEALELDTGKKIEQLSLGNRKKVGIVCAMQHNPALYLLDEPTSGLDPLMQQVFFELLQEKNRAGATVFFSSHVLMEVQRNCSRAAILREGTLAAQGDVSTLMGTLARRVALTGSVPVPELEGISRIEKTPDGVSFLYAGAPKPLLTALSQNSFDALRDVTITEPSLEEVFLHYYINESKEG